jgi:hypothetical protein
MHALFGAHVKCEENEKGAEEDALKTILEENGCRRKYTFNPAENTQFRVGGHTPKPTLENLA